MKKNNLYILSVMLLLGLLSSCFEDEGNYNYVDLPRFEVDTTGVTTLMSIRQFDTVDIPSHLIYDGDKSKLDYTWSAYVDDNYGTNIADTLATTENFHEQITLQPERYVLEFCATNRETGLKTKMKYIINVESYSGAGLMIFYSNGSNCDIDIIRTKSFLGSISVNEVRRNIYSNIVSNPKLTGTPVGIGDMGDYLDIVTTEEALQTSRNDFGMTRDFNAMFFENPGVKKPQGYSTITNSGDKVFINNGLAYICIRGSEYYPTARTMVNDSYYASPYTVFAYGMNNVIFDEEHSRFLYCGMYSGTFEKAGDSKLANMDKTLLGFHRGFTDGKIRFSNYAYAVMKSKSDDSQRFIHVISAARNAVDIKQLYSFNISAFPEICQATDYAFSEVSPLFYYSSEHSLYVCPFSLDQNSITTPSVASWTCPAGESITCMKLFKDSGVDLAVSAAHKYVVVATYNGKIGKVYILKTDMASGVIDSTPVETYEGFGRISVIEFKNS